MSNTEKMLVRVEADTSSLRSELERGGVSVDKFASGTKEKLSGIDAIFSRLQKLTLIGGTLGVGITAAQQFSVAVRENIKSIAELGDQAEQLGLTTAALQELNLAALENGSSAETMASSLDQFNKRLGEAQNGTGGLLDLMKQYGIAVTDAEGRNRSSIDVLNDIADVLSSTADNTERARIATEAFGRSGTELIQLLSQGSAGLRSYADEAHRLGVVIDSDLIAKAKKFDDEVNRMTYIVEVNFKRMSITITDTVVAALDESIKLADEFSSTLANALNGSGNAGSVSQLPSYSRLDLKSKKSDLENFAGGDTSSYGAFGGVLSRSMNNLGTAQNPFADFYKKSQESAEKSTRAQTNNFAKVLGNLTFETEQLGRTNAEQELYNNLKAAGVTLTSAEGQQIAAATRAYSALRDHLKDVSDAGAEMGQSITQSLNGAILSGNSLKSTLSSIINSIASTMLTKSVTGPIGEWLGGTIANFKFANGGIMTSEGPLPLRKYAAGGIANTPQLAMYGEGKMPEAYVPLPDGRTIPVTMRGGGGGSGVQVVQHLNITTGVEQTTRAEILRMMPQIRQAAVAAVGDATKRRKLNA